MKGITFRKIIKDARFWHPTSKNNQRKFVEKRLELIEALQIHSPKPSLKVKS